MTTPRSWSCAMALALMTAGCSTPAAAPPAPPSPKASSTAAAPTPSPTSAFCLDLTTFQVGVVVFRGDVGKAIRGQPLDFEDLRQRAVMIDLIGKKMQASAPPDIAGQFRTVLKAINTSASRLKPGANVRDVVDPLYGKRNRPAFDAVEHYECAAAGQ
ncbi:MAG: hypothetical protein ACRDOO_26365 [Actinomadura sp.]